MTLTVKRAQKGYAVFEGGKRVTEAFPSAQAAEYRMRDMLRERARRERRCLTCGTSFLSEGNHNRMCPGCRSRSSGDALYGAHLPGNRVVY